jgi:CBS domain-containing protein
MGTLVKDCMVCDFELLPDTLSLAEALGRLGPKPFGVVTDEKSGLPVAVATADDLRRAADPSILLRDPAAGLPPAVLVDADAEMRNLVASEDFLIFDAGARAAVLPGERQQVVGVLTVAQLEEYLDGEEYRRTAPKARRGDRAGTSLTGASGAALPGIIDLPPGSQLCAACNYVNRVAYFDRAKPPLCQNPAPPAHRLQ